MVVDPRVSTASDHIFRVVPKIVVHAYVAISGDFCTARAECVVALQVVSGKLGVGTIVEWSQQNCAKRVVREVAANIGAGHKCFGERSRFGLAERERPGTNLFAVHAPTGRKLSVEIKIPAVGCCRDFHAVVFANSAFVDQPEKRSIANICGGSRHKQPRITVADLPRSVSVDHSHRE